MKIDWTKFSAIAEILSAVAIIVTLAYLAVQTQQTNSALFANSREATMNADVNFLLTAVDYPHLNASLEEPLEGMEAQRFFNLMGAFFRIREFTWFQYQQGILDEEAFESYMQTTVRLVRTERVQQIWDRVSSDLDAGFVRAINERAGI
jgi:hypothetical protein